MMKDAWATSGISKLEAYGGKKNSHGKNSTSKVYAFAFLYILFWKKRIWVIQLERLSSFNYPSFSYFKYANTLSGSQDAQRFSDRQVTYV